MSNISNGRNPLVSYCILAYNSERFIDYTIENAVNQTYEPLEIIISDDCSSDSTFKEINNKIKNYKGPHKIIINRNMENMGIGAHFSKVATDIASGKYIVSIAADDISNLDHVEKAVETIEKFPNANIIDFSGKIINEKGDFVREIRLEKHLIKHDIEDYLRLNNIHSFAPGRIIRRDMLDYFNRISIKCPTEDSVMVLRSLLLGEHIRVDLPLVSYRIHKNNISNTVGISKISNVAIIIQYLSDIICLYNKNLLSDKQFEILNKRVQMELILRKIKYQNQYKFKTKLIRILLFLFYKKIFKLKLKHLNKSLI